MVWQVSYLCGFFLFVLFLTVDEQVSYITSFQQIGVLGTQSRLTNVFLCTKCCEYRLNFVFLIYLRKLNYIYVAANPAEAKTLNHG